VFGEPSQVTYTLTPEPESITWAAITFVPEFGMITITAIENKMVLHYFFVVADDGALENNIARHPFSFTVVAVDDPPVFMLSRDQVVVNEVFFYNRIYYPDSSVKEYLLLTRSHSSQRV
jgi:hypothetical protein